ncbi:glycine betaine ABC transporter substrate-binding protein [Pseudomonas granadensis]|nr:glycine betaine ABC transporter substrate-binding protein [Pseudomonas granadensis]MBN6805675.1 glycine betaine ABC transporter substrate-binding protein [Pseudomonas granadensis]MBN6832551.1 glycine betaine ABC transporter substrate-binding protein [Pseudomonas granadensis]MBN6839869.1 glycine betaine ABC transporter substrate-binding protein [Pseudomonas granadensis]MBN6869244.1 glycine betaine ABC transporter substrate-binding protein [Pseudomonas granadensis]
MIYRMLASLVISLSLASGVIGSASANSTIVVGGKKFTEQQLIAEMTAQLLRANGYKVDKRADLGSSVLRAAQENGQVDVYWEYTGTSLITYNKITDKLSAEETYKKISELDAQKGITWLNPSKANNTYALAMRKVDAEKDGIVSISDLAKNVEAGKSYKFASNAEFFSRPDGLRPLQEEYGFEFERKNIVRMDGGLTYQALRDGQVDLALVLSTDGRIPAFGFLVLRDDKGFFPGYALTPVIRTEVLEGNPRVGELLNGLASKLDDETIAGLNSRVDVGRESVEGVAKAFLQRSGLL